MKPVSPIIPGESLPITVYARVLFSGNVYLWMLTFNHPLQPIMLQVDKPQVTNNEESAAIGALARKVEARG